MATYLHKAFAEGPYWHPTSGATALVFREPTRVYADGDILKLCKVERDLKIADASYAGDRLDTNGAPTATGVLEITDGVTPLTLITFTTAHLGSATASARIARLDNPAMLGFVVPTRGYWLQVRFTAAFATAATGIIAAGVSVTALLFGQESALRPTG